jgi:hypothetical protein
MEFTAPEMKLIEGLRKQDRQWRWRRWAMLGVGTFSIALCAGFGYLTNGLIKEAMDGPLSAQFAFFIMLFWTKCCFYFAFGIVCFATAWTKWHGDANRMLLLKLLDSQQKLA